eukprot:5019772-Amphidinium_carterae.1
MPDFWRTIPVNPVKPNFLVRSAGGHRLKYHGQKRISTTQTVALAPLEGTYKLIVEVMPLAEVESGSIEPVDGNRADQPKTQTLARPVAIRGPGDPPDII